MKPLDFALYAVVVFGWSTSWLPLKWQVGEVAPEVSLIWRFLVAGSLMFVLGFLTKRRLKLSGRGHLAAMAMGVCLFSTNFMLFYYGSVSLVSGLLAVIFASASLINVFYSAAVHRTAIRPLALIAAGLGFSGILLMYWPEISGSSAALTALMLCIAGTLFFCTGNMISSVTQKHNMPVIGMTAWGMVYGALWMTFIALLRGQEFTIEMTPTYIFGGLWLAVFSSVLAFSAYLTLLGRIGASKAAYATVIFPIFALLISTVVEGYVWTLFSFSGLALVVFGIVLMNRSRG